MYSTYVYIPSQSFLSQNIMKQICSISFSYYIHIFSLRIHKKERRVEISTPHLKVLKRIGYNIVYLFQIKNNKEFSVISLNSNYDLVRGHIQT